MPRLACALIVLLVAAAGEAGAQDFSVKTKIRDARNPGKPPVGQSVTLFHAGKVYDCLDSGNRMTVFEPAQERFVIIDSSRRVAATISLSELGDWLYQEDKRLEGELSKRKSEPDRWDVQLADFQLHPVFQSRFDAAKKSLELSSRVMTYSVKCDKSNPVQLGEAYLDYADWAARLNYIMIPQAAFPGPRLQLNEALRRQQLLPVEVSWKLNRTNGTHQIAQHQYNWKLESRDRDLILEWEKLLRDPGIKTVPLDQLLFPAKPSAKGEKLRPSARPVSSRK